MRNLTKQSLMTACIAAGVAILAPEMNQTGPIRADADAIAAVGNDDVLNHVPANVDLVEVINDLSGLHDKLTTLMQKLRIPGQLPNVGFYAARLGITAGLDVHGTAAVVVPRLINAPDSNEHITPIILFPATDSDKMLSSMNPESAQNGISAVQPHMGMSGFAAVTGHYVAFSTDQQALTDFLASKQQLFDTLSTNDVNMLDSGDVGFYLNVVSIREPAEKSMDASFDNMTQMMQTMGMGQNQKMIDQAKFGTAMDKIFIHEILDDLKSGVLTLSITDDGISIDADHQFESGTPLADFLTDSKPLGGKPFAGLPEISPTMAWSANLSGGWMSEMLKKWSDTLANNPDVSSLPQVQQTIQQWNQASQLYQSVHNQTMVMSLNPMIKGFSVTTFDDPQKALELQRKITASAIDNLQFQNLSQLGMNMSGQYTQNALSVDGVSFDKAVFNIKPAGNAPSDPGTAIAMELVQNILGPDGITAYSGVVGNDMLSDMNTSNDELQSAVEAAKNSTDAVDADPAIMAASQHVLPDASIIVYAKPSALLEAVANIIRQSTGFESPAAAGALALTGDPVSISESGSLGRIFLPTSELEQMSDDIHQLIPLVMMMSMSQQQQPIQPRQ
jgi:hypothetical protein